MKEMNIETKKLSIDEYLSFFKEHPNFPKENEWFYNEAKIFADYFYELGVNVQKQK